MKKLILTLLAITFLDVFSGENNKIDYLNVEFKDLSKQNRERFSKNKNRLLLILKKKKRLNQNQINISKTKEK